MKQTDSTTENLLRTLPEPLLGWYRENARDLPWRHTEDPYRTWVSEIMLQQTRVAAVLGYYARFLAVFPTVEALAEADEERLMKLWEGLGYYSRARTNRFSLRRNFFADVESNLNFTPFFVFLPKSRNLLANYGPALYNGAS